MDEYPTFSGEVLRSRSFNQLQQLELIALIARCNTRSTHANTNRIIQTSLTIMISSAEERCRICKRIATRQKWQVLPFQNATSLEAFHASSLNISSINLCGSPTVCKCLLQPHLSVQAHLLSRAISSVSLPSGALRCCTWIFCFFVSTSQLTLHCLLPRMYAGIEKSEGS